MAKRITAKEKKESKEFFEALRLMEEEKGTGAYKSISLPSVIEAEDFDYATWYASDNVNDSRIYRKNTGIDIYPVDSDEY